MVRQEIRYFTQVCTKCGHVFNEYLAKSRKASDGLRVRDEGEVVKAHDLQAHGSDGEWLETTNIQFTVKAKVTDS